MDGLIHDSAELTIIVLGVVAALFMAFAVPIEPSPDMPRSHARIARMIGAALAVVTTLVLRRRFLEIDTR